MIIEVKYFYEKTDEDYETYNKLWDENIERMIFLQTHLSYNKQIHDIINQLNNNNNKDILSIRFPLINEIKNNKIIDNILLGNGFIYISNKVWYPKEIWIYNTFEKEFKM